MVRSFSGIAAVALVAVGSWSIRERTAGIIAEAIVLVRTPAAPAVRVTTQESSSMLPMTASTVDSVPVVAQALLPVADTVHVASAEGALAATDSIRWEPAVARTWVNVRRDASREGDVVGVIKPTDKAMLGIGRSGWRQVKSPDVTGWVDPRLFESDSLRTRG